MKIDVAETTAALRRGGYSVRINHYRLVYFSLQSTDCLQQDEIDACIVRPTVSQIGGFTRVEIIDNDTGRTFTAKHNFNGRPFCKKIGVQAALGKAIKESQCYFALVNKVNKSCKLM